MTRQTASSPQPLSRALLVCNGEQPSRSLARRLARQAQLIVAADGGANSARKLGITPDLIIGDLDSVTPVTLKFFSAAAVIHVARQDNTDMEKALDYILAQSLTQEVMIIGATGRRIDHTLGNLAVLSNYARRLRLVACGDGWHAFPIRSSEQIYAPRGTTVSLIPFGNCRGVTLKGLQYPLHDAPMLAAHIAVSNVVKQSPFTISLRRGKLLAVVLAEFIPR